MNLAARILGNDPPRPSTNNAASVLDAMRAATMQRHCSSQSRTRELAVEKR